MKKEIILASNSDRRAKILSDCGIRHRVVPSGARELMDKNMPVSEIVSLNAELKAASVAELEKDAVVIGADTLVVVGADIIGKPADEEAAYELLKSFSGAQMEVYTGLCVIDSDLNKRAIGVEKSELSVVSLSDDEITSFFPLMKPYDKAGGFSIEGAGSFLFDNIRGSYFNILGLPMKKLRELFAEIGHDIIEHITS